MPATETDDLEIETARADAAASQRSDIAALASYVAALVAPIVGLFVVL